MLVILYFGKKNHIIVSELFGTFRAIGVMHIIVLRLFPCLCQVLIHHPYEPRNGVISTVESPADEIYETFGISKKNFKMALGSLYKEKIVEIRPDGVKLKNGNQKW